MEIFFIITIYVHGRDFPRNYSETSCVVQGLLQGTLTKPKQWAFQLSNYSRRFQHHGHELRNCHSCILKWDINYALLRFDTKFIENDDTLTTVTIFHISEESKAMNPNHTEHKHVFRFLVRFGKSITNSLKLPNRNWGRCLVAMPTFLLRFSFQADFLTFAFRIHRYNEEVNAIHLRQAILAQMRQNSSHLWNFHRHVSLMGYDSYVVFISL